MAAYAAVVSLMHTIDQIQRHPCPPISIHKTQVESLTRNLTFLQEFLQGYSADDWEMRIADAAYAAEDVIDEINARSISEGNTITNSVDLYKALQKSIQDMDLIEKQIKEKSSGVMQRRSLPATAESSSRTRQNIPVGLDDVVIEIMDKLIAGQPDCRIIPIAGMGGSGKTFLAQNVFRNQVVVQHFDILSLVTISQEYRVGEILSKLLSKEGGESESQTDSESKLGEMVHKRLWGRRYLIILDDIWDIEVWDQLRKFFPNNSNGSRIMLTTRLSNLAYQVAGSSNVFKMRLLNEDHSWDLFCKTAFGEEGCPFELEETGKKIVENCRGLPLAIIVVAGLLAKTQCEREYWERTGKNLSSAVNSEDDESCRKILYMSYIQLPVHLKPCFLYMGIFQEDVTIHVSTVTRLWVAEGFLKPIRRKSLEMVAREYLKELIDRNLIQVHQLGSTGSIKICKIHDLLRDLCLKEAQKERFYSVVTGQHSLPQSINSSRRIVVLDSTSDENTVTLNTGSALRSWIWNSRKKPPFLDFRLLRVLKAYERHPFQGREYFFGNKVELFNSRYVSTRADLDFNWASSVCVLWNLQTLIVHSMRSLTVPSEIWKMTQLRHIEFSGSGVVLPDPPTGEQEQDCIVLVNLQTLNYAVNCKCGEEMIKKIPNIEKLKLHYVYIDDDSPDYCVSNVERLHKLESFRCTFMYDEPTVGLQKPTFPRSLKKLTLNLLPNRNWEDIMENIGSLPHLEKLRLTNSYFHGHKWETVEGQFCSLKFLEIGDCDLKYWTTHYTHFPRLENLVLFRLSDLEEIPSNIGEIPTLLAIKVRWCSDGAVISAEEIAMEQQELGNEDLRVEVSIDRWRNKALMGLKSTTNFEVKFLQG